MSRPPDKRAVLIDLAGVLHTGDQALPGTIPALARLRAAGLPLRFLTNTTRTPSDVLFQRLCAMGFDLQASELQTAALAARTLVRQRGLKPLWLVHPDIAAEMGPSAAEPDVVVLGDMDPTSPLTDSIRPFACCYRACRCSPWRATLLHGTGRDVD